MFLIKVRISMYKNYQIENIVLPRIACAVPTAQGSYHHFFINLHNKYSMTN